MSAKGRNLVGTYRKQGTFRAQHAEKTGRAAQRTALPPRCELCRLPGTLSKMIDGTAHFYCTDHYEIELRERSE